MTAEEVAAPASGGCLCGAVTFEISGPLRDVFFCHCTRCRRTHGHFSAYTTCAEGDLRLNEDSGLRWFELGPTRRGFCRDCGASLFWQRVAADTISVSAGTLDARPGSRQAATFSSPTRGTTTTPLSTPLPHSAAAPVLAFAA